MNWFIFELHHKRKSERAWIGNKNHVLASGCRHASEGCRQTPIDRPLCLSKIWDPFTFCYLLSTTFCARSILHFFFWICIFFKSSFLSNSIRSSWIIISFLKTRQYPNMNNLVDIPYHICEHTRKTQIWCMHRPQEYFYQEQVVILDSQEYNRLLQSCINGLQRI